MTVARHENLMSTFSRFVRICLVGGVLCGASGCASLWSEKKLSPELDLRRQNVVMVPFKQGNRWYFESEAGAEFSRFLFLHLQRDCKGFQEVSDTQVEEEIATNLDEKVPWASVGSRVDADYVVFGTIEKISFDSQEVYGMFQGRVVATCKVWDVRADRQVFSRRVAVQYPENPDHGGVIVSFEQNRPEVQRKLFLLATKKLVLLFCGGTIEMRDQ